MGLIKEVDDNLGRLFALLAKNGRIADTMIVFTSDHGDYLGDHWLGEKEMFHEESVRIPMIVCDPDDAADATRGTRDDRLVEAIDLVPTFVEAVGGAVAGERLEGRSLLPLLRAAPGEPWRDAVFAEADYAFREARVELGRGPRDARAYMVRTADWKYVHFEGYGRSCSICGPIRASSRTSAPTRPMPPCAPSCTSACSPGCVGARRGGRSPMTGSCRPQAPHSSAAS